MNWQTAIKAISALISLFLANHYVNIYNARVANLPTSGPEVYFCINTWNENLLWLKHKLYIAMLPFAMTITAIALYNAYVDYKKSGKPFLKWLVGVYIEYYRNIWRRLEKWVSTNTSASA